MGTNDETMNALAAAIESTLKPVDFDGLPLGIPALHSLTESTKANINNFDFGEVNHCLPWRQRH